LSPVLQKNRNFARKARDLRHWLLFMSDKVINVKAKVKRYLYRPITRPDGSRRLRFPYFETVEKD